MHDDNETHEPPRRTPQQIMDAIAQSDVVLTINRTGNLLHRVDVRKQRLQPKIRDEILEDAAAFAGVGFSAHLGGTTAASFSGN
jgi:hypothetical protein